MVGVFKGRAMEDLVEYRHLTKAETFILIAPFWNSLSESCITDPSDLSSFLQTKPIMHKTTSKKKIYNNRNNLNRVLKGLFKSRRALRFTDLVRRPICRHSWGCMGFTRLLPNSPGKVGKIFLKSAHTFKRSAWLMLSFCVCFSNDQ